MEQQKTKKNKNIKRIIGGCLSSCLVMLILTFLPLLLIVSSFMILKINTDDIIEEVKKNLPQSVQKLLNAEILNEDFKNQNLNISIDGMDLKPQPLDITQCEGCDCVKNDRYFNISANGELLRVQDTKRLNTEQGSGKESYLNMDWIYNGWTIDDSSYWDIDFGKFSYKEVDDPNEFLFKHKVNNFQSWKDGAIGNMGRCTFTLEFRHKMNKSLMETQKEDTRNGSFVEHTTTLDNSICPYKFTEYLDFGTYKFGTADSRIAGAFSPMITAGQAGFENCILARQYFHKISSWQRGHGTNPTPYTNAFAAGGLNLWKDDVGKNAYIDVVFQDNVSGKQIVIPFIYKDAKDLHWFDSMGQRLDQRYGQIHGTINAMYSNGNHDIEVSTYTGILELIASNDSELQKSDYKDYEIISLADLNNNTTNTYFTKNDIYNGNKLPGLEINEDINWENVVLVGIDKYGYNGYFRFKDLEKKTETVTKNYYGDNDIVQYDYFTPLELCSLIMSAEDFNNIKPEQSQNNLIIKTLLDGYIDLNNGPNNSRPDWSLWAMRVYTKNNRDFTEKSKQFETITEIPDDNKIIDFCNSNCKCTICSKIAR